MNSELLTKLKDFTDAELLTAVLYRAGFEPKVVRQATETVVTTVVNGQSKGSVKTLQSGRIEFGFAMDFHTKYAEFDTSGKLVYIGQETSPNY